MRACRLSDRRPTATHPGLFGLCVVLSGLVLVGAAISDRAGAAPCESLSYRRNSIYKDAGYCFKTAAQIRNFGNAGCRYDDVNDVPLSANQRAEIAAIVSEERDDGCR